MRHLALLPLLAALPATAAPPSKPDILIVIWDATRPDHLTPYGYNRDTTPNLAKLASKALVFERAHSSSTWTVPSVSGILTGSFNHNTTIGFDATNPNLDLPEVLTTMPELLKAQGYQTSIWTAQNIFTQQKGFLQGFDHAYAPKDVPIPQFHEAALAFLDSADPGFAVVYYLDPHAPYEPPAAHDLWRDKTQPPVNIRGCPKEPPSGGFPEGHMCHSDVNSGVVTFNGAQWQQLRDRYDGELHKNDAFLGLMMAKVEARQASEPTAVFFTSDHGEAFNEHSDERTWHRLPYQTILRVPLIAAIPGVAPRRVKTVVRTIDLYPTVASLAGVTPTGIDGQSLLDLAAKDGPDRVLSSHSHFAGAPVAYVEGGWKIMFSRTGPSWTKLYDLNTDPDEMTDLATTRPDMVAKLKAQRDAFLKATSRGLSAVGKGEQTKEQLRALGYTD
jgi:arylsulfatase A-like enzyme